jgi:hypothetical protein
LWLNPDNMGSKLNNWMPAKRLKTGNPQKDLLAGDEPLCQLNENKAPAADAAKGPVNFIERNKLLLKQKAMEAQKKRDRDQVLNNSTSKLGFSFGITDAIGKIFSFSTQKMGLSALFCSKAQPPKESEKENQIMEF